MLWAWLCLLFGLAMLGLTLVGYPLWIAWQSRSRPRRRQRSDWQPSVTVCLAVYNGAQDIERKLLGLLSHDYPQDKLDVVVVDDGSDDDTVARIRALADARITLLQQSQRGGKTAALNQALQQARGEVLVLCDVRQRLEPGSINALCHALSDPATVVVGGRLCFEGEDSAAASVGLYWRFESWLRRAEAACGSVPGVSGALYAVRRADMPTIPPGLILDDVWVPMALAADGRMVDLESAAIAWDRPAPNLQIEARRKRRTLAGNWQLFALQPRWLLPGGHPLWARLVGHKLLRALLPIWFAFALLGNVGLAWQGQLLWLLLLQLIGHGMGLAAIALPGLKRMAPFKWAAALEELNYYAVLGLLDHLRGGPGHLWSTTRLNASIDRGPGV
ncbi:glycosyltransferase [Pseudomarimonas arenosa]|uniref:Glycosyltransferase n=1 Tax=Pseudomarimonas arenosa TaxID=2774145 RepID=A0AAW3ZK62_9GAMM|nr:glycosyltransferase [Pseudomarimonas arenosa]MBD8524846.1 glycosyltransferase [Pseudomarimonas arenosa]